MRGPIVLCAVDFSDASRGALRYAAALAEHFYAGLTVLTVSEPLGGRKATGATKCEQEMRACRELEAFVHASFPGRTPQVGNLTHLVVFGTPAEEILRVVHEQHADVLVMGAHGTGRPGQAFGSTVEAVLRRTTVPAIVTPESDPGPESVDDWHGSIRSIIVPVDLSPYSVTQLQIGRGLALALDRPLVLAHVLAPTASAASAPALDPAADACRRDNAECQLARLLTTLPEPVKASMSVRVGDPAREIARLAKDSAGILVMGLHASPETKQRIGSVTYRVLCQAAGVVVAWPPSMTAGQHPLARVPMKMRASA